MLSAPPRLATTRFLTRLALPIVGALSVLLAWQFLFPWLGVPRYILPTPTQVAHRMASSPGQLWDNFVPTALESLLGFLLGNAVAIGLAVVFAFNRRVASAYFPVVLFLNTIPVLAIAPVFVLTFGTGLAPKIVVAGIICFFPTLINMTRGLQSAGANERELFRILSASWSETFWKLFVPRSLPFLFASLRISATACVVGAIVGEWIGTNKGLGIVILQSTFNYRSDLLYSAIALSSLLAILFYGAVLLTEWIFTNTKIRGA